MNASAGRAFAASHNLYEVVERALQFCDMTDGLFNPAVIHALEAAGYDRTFEAIDPVNEHESMTGVRRPSPVVCPRITLNPDRREITLPSGVRLDLGGIAKGWAVQQAATRLAQTGPCLVDAGGDMMTFGVAPGETGWRVGVADPHDSRQDLLTLRLRDIAVATSGIDRRRWVRSGEVMHHLIDPRTGLPSTSDLISVTVVAPTTVEAEVYAKVVFLMGADEGLSFVEERPSLLAVLVTRSGDIRVSSRLENILDVHFTYDVSEFLSARSEAA
jgi:thiamine biosynthesis lipoprotein